MTVEPNWRIEYGSPGGGEDVAESQLDAYLEVEALKKAGVLIPDTRLQAITDAYRAFDREETNTTWVALTSALHALIKEHNNE